MRPHTTLRRLLVHSKDKVELEEQGELVYQIPHKNCGAEYIEERGRLLKTRLEEHRKDVDNTKNGIDWEGVKIVDKEPDRRIRHIKEAIWIRLEHINRDKGNYEVYHVYDDVIHRHRY